MRLDAPLVKEGAFIAINKPAGIYMEADGIATNPKNIIAAIKAQKGKPELERLGIDTPFAVFVTDPEISGLCLIASNKDAATTLRNDFGSGNMRFEFLILSEKPQSPLKLNIALPLLKHEEKPRAIVSHRFGKKASTSFKLLEDLGEYQLWSATTNFLRWHQIRLHAAEAGLRPIGEDTYVRVRKLMLSRLLRRGIVRRTDEEETPIYSNMAYHLAKISFRFGGEEFEASAQLPKKFELMLKKIRSS